jgi:hypothetical protein
MFLFNLSFRSAALSREESAFLLAGESSGNGTRRQAASDMVAMPLPSAAVAVTYATGVNQ